MSPDQISRLFRSALLFFVGWLCGAYLFKFNLTADSVAKSDPGAVQAPSGYEVKTILRSLRREQEDIPTEKRIDLRDVYNQVEGSSPISYPAHGVYCRPLKTVRLKGVHIDWFEASVVQDQTQLTVQLSAEKGVFDLASSVDDIAAEGEGTAQLTIRTTNPSLLNRQLQYIVYRSTLYDANTFDLVRLQYAGFSETIPIHIQQNYSSRHLEGSGQPPAATTSSDIAVEDPNSKTMLIIETLCGIYLVKFNLTADSVAKSDPGAVQPPSGYEVKTVLRYLRREEVDIPTEERIDLRDVHNQVEGSSPISYPAHGVYCRPLKTVRLKGVHIDWFEASVVQDQTQLTVHLSEEKGVFDLASSVDDVAAEGEGTAQLTIRTTNPTLLNRQLQYIVYRSTLYDANTFDLGTFQDRVTVVVKTFYRYSNLKRLIASFQEHYPGTRLVIADDTPGELFNSVQAPNVDHFRMPEKTVSATFEKEPRQMFSSTLHITGDKDHICLLQQYEPNHFHEIPGFPGCYANEICMNFFMASTNEMKSIGFDPDPALARIGHAADSVAKSDPGAVQAPSGYEVKTVLRYLRREEVDIPTEERIDLRNVHNQVEGSSPISYPAHGVYCRPLKTVRLKGVHIDWFEASVVQDQTQLTVHLSAEKGVFDLTSSVDDVAAEGEGTAQLTIRTTNPSLLNRQLQYIVYRSTLYDANTFDLVRLQYAGFTATMPIHIQQVQLPWLYDQKGGKFQDRVTVVVKTFLRYSNLKRLIASFQEHYPGTRMVIADDTPSELFTSVQAPNVDHFRMPENTGYFAGRNLGLSQVSTEYFLYTDDDHYIRNETRLDMTIINMSPDFSLFRSALLFFVGWFCGNYLFKFNLTVDSVAKREPGAIQAPSGYEVKTILRSLRREQVDIPTEEDTTCNCAFQRPSDFLSPWDLANKQKEQAATLERFEKRRIDLRDVYNQVEGSSPISYPAHGVYCRPRKTVRLKGVGIDWFDSTVVQDQTQLTVQLSAEKGVFDLASSVDNVAGRGKGPRMRLQYAGFTATMPIHIQQVQLPWLYDQKGGKFQDRVTVVVKTFLRYSNLKRLIASFQEHYPGTRMVIADDTPSEVFTSVQAPNVDHFRMPENTVSATYQKYRSRFSTTFEVTGDKDHICLLQTFKPRYFHEIPGFPGCYANEICANFFMASTNEMKAVGFDPDPALARVGHEGGSSAVPEKGCSVARMAAEPCPCLMLTAERPSNPDRLRAGPWLAASSTILHLPPSPLAHRRRSLVKKKGRAIESWASRAEGKREDSQRLWVAQAPQPPSRFSRVVPGGMQNITSWPQLNCSHIAMAVKCREKERVVLPFVWPLTRSLPGLVRPARGMGAPAGIAHRILKALKHPHHDKVAVRGGRGCKYTQYYYYYYHYMETSYYNLKHNATVLS
uniref:Glycosyltransferase 2-like domain-containing protein n=1 Tax=Branchiostoma floridae TaxID=7739 RepID=C3ZR01_BRAFL|eukprot:XP_002589031.1 hypothetical protein BRAFLDRAFT_87504 [Branchiostoma floridae]